jgi:hypothetical protein
VRHVAMRRMSDITPPRTTPVLQGPVFRGKPAVDWEDIPKALRGPMAPPPDV